MNHTLSERLALWVASLAGVGFAPFSSGTLGTLVTIPFFVFLVGPLPLAGRAAVLLAVTLLGVWAAHVAERVWEQPDSSRIVIDESAGFLLCMLPFDPLLGPIVAGFAFFRIFDIAKPFPCRRIDQNVKGGWGVVLDDLVAGLYALLCVALLDHLLAARGLAFYGLGASS